LFCVCELFFLRGSFALFSAWQIAESVQPNIFASSARVASGFLSTAFVSSSMSILRLRVSRYCVSNEPLSLSSFFQAFILDGYIPKASYSLPCYVLFPYTLSLLFYNLCYMPWIYYIRFSYICQPIITSSDYIHYYSCSFI
jgi:hypothetical protein